MGRWKMRLRIWFLGFWIPFLGFPNTLGGFRNKIPEFGIHLTGLGRVCIDQTQNLRKIMKSTWLMNKSICGVFLDKIRPYNIHTSHIKPSPKIWFEMEDFKNLGFSSPRLRVPPVTSWAWNGSREKFSWILEICKV
jgi:hypothetical protein